MNIEEKNLPRSFFLDIHKPLHFKNCIEALADLNFNPSSKGRVDVTAEKGFEISTLNIQESSAGHAAFMTPGFSCFTPLQGRTIKLSEVVDGFGHHVIRLVTVSHVKHSNHLSFHLTVLALIKSNKAKIKLCFKSEYEKEQNHSPSKGTDICFKRRYPKVLGRAFTLGSKAQLCKLRIPRTYVLLRITVPDQGFVEFLLPTKPQS